MEQSNSTSEEVLALPAPQPKGEASTAEEKVLTVGGEAIRFDNLGPMVLNTDGSLSRITNWHELSEVEQQNTLRVIAKRNKQRREALTQQQQNN